MLYNYIFITKIKDTRLYKNHGKAKYIFITFIYIQCTLGILWTCNNFGCITQFGDTNAYVYQSNPLRKTSIRTVLYPLLIRISMEIEKLTNISYCTVIYTIQSLCSILCIYYFLNVLKENLNDRWNKNDVIIYTLFLHFIPQINEFNLSVLSDSLAYSMLLLVVANGIKWVCEGNLNKKDLVILILAIFLGNMLRYERKILHIVFLIVIFIILSKYKEISKKNVFILACLLVIPLLFVKVTDICSKSVENDNRHEQTATMVVLPKVARGYMEECYEYLSDDAKCVISLELAGAYDRGEISTSDFIIYIEQSVGQDTANKMIYSISWEVFKNTYRKQTANVLKDCFLYANPLMFGVLELNLVHVGGLDWNYSRFIMNTPTLSKLYYNFTLYFGLMLLIVVIAYLIWKEKNILKDKIRVVIAPFVMAFLLTGLWGVVNNSKPNDRYVLYIYFVWFVIFIVGFEESLSIKKQKVLID